MADDNNDADDQDAENNVHDDNGNYIDKMGLTIDDGNGYNDDDDIDNDDEDNDDDDDDTGGGGLPRDWGGFW